MAWNGMAQYGRSLLGSGATSTERSEAAGGKNIFSGAGSIMGSGGGGGGGLFGGISGGEWLGAGLTLLGGFMGDRSDRRTSREQARANRENTLIQREVGLQGIRGQMQQSQDEYAREIMRNRGAIAPWAERYSGPAFTSATPNAPIYNPLMEAGHLYGQLDPSNAPRVPAEAKPPAKPRKPRRK